MLPHRQLRLRERPIDYQSDEIVMLMTAIIPVGTAVKAEHAGAAPDDLPERAGKQGTFRHLGQQNVELRR